MADPSRGLMMGNRGCIHDDQRKLGITRWRSKLWICCVLKWKNVRRDVMPPGRWTALFFLDEATAFAAGHRPCAYCRRADYLAFAEAWRRAHDLSERPRAAAMDVRLHAERVESRTRRQRTRTAVAGTLPDGVIVRHGDQLSLLAGGLLFPWSFSGYGEPSSMARDAPVEVLTPPAITATIAAGYAPLCHPSARTRRGNALRFSDSE